MAGFWQQVIGVALGFALIVGGVVLVEMVWGFAKMICPPLEAWEDRRMLESIDGRAKLREEAGMIEEGIKRWEQSRRGGMANIEEGMR